MTMSTPIRDFVKNYVEKSPLRLHMPGHKGLSLMGIEAYDITEVAGADSLYEADGIIRESEKNASLLFGCPTYYSTEGSSQCIRAMLYLTALCAMENGTHRPLILAGRNAHKAFLSAIGLLDLDIEWLYPENESGYLECSVSPSYLEREISRLSAAGRRPSAVYLTSPDYLGNTVDVACLSEICHKHGILLLIDNAHGAYLRFLSPSRHPIDLGADICCDSAHKTLPVLTGGAYLHISTALSETIGNQVKHALSLFGSTSPSYLILQSLDIANAVIADGNFASALKETAERVSACRERLTRHGISAKCSEPIKLTIYPNSYGYTGSELSEYLHKCNIECEFADPNCLVLMFSPAITDSDTDRLTDALLSLPKKSPISLCPPPTVRPERAMTVREALFSPSEVLPVHQCAGRVLAAANIGCPPAVPIVACGEVIDEGCVACFDYYGIETCAVVK